MLNASFAPFLVGLVVVTVATFVGVAPVKKLIQVEEAKHELKQGSAGFLRSIAGWSVIVFWLGGAWFVGTVLGDWSASGDLNGAIARGLERLWVFLSMLQFIAESDV